MSEPDQAASRPIVTKHPLELGNRMVDRGVIDERTNRITNKLSELGNGLAVVESFSHVIVFETDDGLVCFDSSNPRTGTDVANAIRAWRSGPVHTLVYTHGHIDHVGGSGAFVAAHDRTAPPIDIVGHRAVAPRFRRYQQTSGYNNIINQRQFGGVSASHNMQIGSRPGGERPRSRPFLPDDVAWPTTEFDQSLSLNIGGLAIELHHDKGETDDHTWAWIPDHRAVVAGDFVTWVFPNCGNPQKVQRFPLEWAQALRKMQRLEPDLLLGAHGLPVQGAERVDRVLSDLAESLEYLVTETLDRMNDGASLDTIVNSVAVPAEWLDRPWMRPIYDEPEFVIRNIWRLYGGWWDQNPANLKPASDARLAAEIVALAGGTDQLVRRAEGLSADGDFRLACHLIELAARAQPESVAVHAVRAAVYQARRDQERSLMAKGVFADAARKSRDIAAS